MLKNTTALKGRQKIVLGDAAGFQQKQVSRNEPT
jgi:hypothetical protein